MEFSPAGLAADTVSRASLQNPASITMAKKVLDQQKQDGETAQKLIQGASPPGVGKNLDVSG